MCIPKELYLRFVSSKYQDMKKENEMRLGWHCAQENIFPELVEKFDTAENVLDEIRVD